MGEKDIFGELIKDLDPFDQKLLRVLDALRLKQGSMVVRTSRFELCALLHMEYSGESVLQVDAALRRLQTKALFVPGRVAGFARATRAISSWEQQNDSEKLMVTLGSVFAR
ncbi:MAG: hypothetical protein JRI36_00590 [Deltaproteobacteria bacterium]|nr:hypothetical protein [Deltaproteobacteria bacterium]